MESCKWNKDIHWKIMTDCGEVSNPAENVELIPMSFPEFSTLVSDRLHINFQPEGPYKCCDIKPVLGYVFENKIKEYTFWGFGDLDVIYGNLREYYTDLLLDRYDLISTHKTRISGHLCLLRNNDVMRNAFRKVSGWKKVLEAPEHKVFDEKHFSRLFVKHKNWPFWVRRCFDQFSSLQRKSFFKETFSTPGLRFNWIDGSRNFPTLWFCKPNGLTNNRDGSRQFPYMHFMHWKGDVWDFQEDKTALVNLSDDGLEKGWVLSKSGFSVLAEKKGYL